MLDVMLDLETMSTDKDAAIVAIGAVEFDLEAGEIGEKFYVVVDLESAVQMDGVMDVSTVRWWMRQSDDARSIFDMEGELITIALEMFSRWMFFRGDKESVRVWGNGLAFDNVILARAYRRNRIDIPWSGKNNRCYRTVIKLYPHVPMSRVGVHHNAVSDAESQARHLIAIMSQNKQGVRPCQ